LHASRFSNRFPDDPPFRRIAREIASEAGYLRDLGITALLLLPVNEVGSHHSWGYDPAFFYAIENDYGGPDALKALVDTCHAHGLAVLLDVVFNHAGVIDNILWSVARESFFDGDTAWGAMINFDHPQCRHFFAQNLVYLANEFHIDGFRLDHTGTIVHSHHWNVWSSSVRQTGSGGGWEFLHGLRAAVHAEVDSRCLLMAEHLPNEWAVTNYGGPMDTQWCDDFHDRLVDACRGDHVMPSLAAALRLSHDACDDWYKVTNYPESHDEVGNVPDRISHVAGWGRGLRMAKVAAAATLCSRGIPMYFMGSEVGEHEQFHIGVPTTLKLDRYLADPNRRRCATGGTNSTGSGATVASRDHRRLRVHFASGQILAFSRGDRDDYFVVLNFGGWAGHLPLYELNLPHATYRELWNSTWPLFAVPGEAEDEHTNGGRDARLDRSRQLHLPDYGAVILERV
jgi:1,4-alpha-glucan branching enzyme